MGCGIVGWSDIVWRDLRLKMRIEDIEKEIGIHLVAGCWLVVGGCWLVVAGWWLVVAGCWLMAGGW